MSGPVTLGPLAPAPIGWTALCIAALLFLARLDGRRAGRRPLGIAAPGEVPHVHGTMESVGPATASDDCKRRVGW